MPCRFVQSRLAACSDGHRGTRLAERFGDLQPQAATTAGDQGDFAVQPKRVENAHGLSSLNAWFCPAYFRRLRCQLARGR